MCFRVLQKLRQDPIAEIPTDTLKLMVTSLGKWIMLLLYYKELNSSYKHTRRYSFEEHNTRAFKEAKDAMGLIKDELTKRGVKLDNP